MWLLSYHALNLVHPFISGLLCLGREVLTTFIALYYSFYNYTPPFCHMYVCQILHCGGSAPAVVCVKFCG